jgi:hypothetical protein
MCVGMDQPEPTYRDVHLDDLNHFLRPFGEISRLLIFSKKTQLKAFVEFVALEAAQTARVILHDSTVDKLGKVRLFFSALQSLEFSNRYLEYKEYVPSKRASVSSNLSSTRLSVSETIALAESVLMFEEAAPQVEEKPVRQVLGEKRNFFNTNQPSQTTNLFKRNSDIETANKEPIQSAWKRGSLDCRSQNLLVLSRRSLFSKVTNPQEVAPIFSSTTPSLIARNEPDTACPGISHTPSPVLLISNLQECFFSATELYAVFSCFGNIVKVLLMKNLKKALVEYHSEEAAAAAVAGINLRQFGTIRVKVNFSKYRKIDLKKNNKSENSQQFNEVMIVSPEMRRYNDNQAHEASAPSNTLLFVMERSDSLKPIDLFNHVSSLGTVVGTRTLVVEDQSEGEALQKVLFKFRTEVDAIRILAKCHNTEVNGVGLTGVFSQVCL